MTSPQTKATFAHEVQGEIRALPTDAAEKIIALCGPAWVEIEKTLALSWLDEATANALTESLRAVLGDVETRALYRRVGGRLVKNRAFQAAIDALFRIFGVKPHTLLKFAPKVRATLVKDSGTMTYEKVGPQEARMVITGFPASTWDLGTTAIMLAGNLEGGVESTGYIPEVEIRDFDSQGCVFLVRWLRSD